MYRQVQARTRHTVLVKGIVPRDEFFKVNNNKLVLSLHVVIVSQFFLFFVGS
jgi:hypothetical protein